MKRTTREEFRYEGLGFSVVILNAPMVEIRGKWTLDLDFNRLQEFMFRALPAKSSRLTGNEIRFLRQYLRMTLQAFGERFGVSHAAVIKWEAAGNDPTKMTWSTEKDIRLFIRARNADPEEFVEAYRELAKAPGKAKHLHRVDSKELAAFAITG